MPSIDDSFKLLGVLTVGALALTACGDGGDGDDETVDTESEAEFDLDVDIDAGELELISDGSLSVCSDIPYPPFEYYDDEGDVVGFDIDIAEGLAEALDLDLEVIATGFEGIQSGVALDAQQCDLAISGMTITEERQENMLFSDPYLDDNLGLLAASGAGIESLDDLDDVAVGVQAETTGADYAAEEDYETSEFPDSGLLIQGLESGQVEAAIGNISILGYQAGEDEAFEFVEEIDTGEQLGVAAHSDNQALIDAVNEILAEMDSSGFMEDAENRWFHDGETPEEGDGEDADVDEADLDGEDDEEEDS